MSAPASDEIALTWCLSEADHLAFAWGGYKRMLPVTLAASSLVPLLAALLLSLLIGPVAGAATGLAIEGLALGFSAVRVWHLQRARVLTAVRARALSTSPVSGRFSREGILVETTTGRATIGWASVSGVRRQHGFLVLDNNGRPFATIPLAQVSPALVDGLFARAQEWRADPAVPTVTEEPSFDARYDLHTRLEPADAAALARRVSRDTIRAREPRFTILLVAGGIACGASVVAAALASRAAPELRVVLLGSAAAVAALTSGKLWIPTVSGLVAARRIRRRPTALAPTRLLCGPGGFASIGDDGRGSRTWTEVRLVREGGLWFLFVSGNRAVVVPRRAFASDQEFAAFGADVARWIADAPTVRAPLPSVGRAAKPDSTHPWAPPDLS